MTHTRSQLRAIFASLKRRGYAPGKPEAGLLGGRQGRLKRAYLDRKKQAAEIREFRQNRKRDVANAPSVRHSTDQLRLILRRLKVRGRGIEPGKGRLKGMYMGRLRTAKTLREMRISNPEEYKRLAAVKHGLVTTRGVA